MANVDDPIRKRAAKRGAVGGKEDAPHEAAAEFFQTVENDVSELARDPDVLLSIPIWGWQYSGKTCALLTAVHYCTPELHGIGLARIKNRDELDALENRVEIYRGLSLSALAEATTARLAELNREFFEELHWPPGTDVPMHYLLEVRATSGPLGFALFPDIMGGSYEKADEIAKNAISGAHAMMILVNPNEYRASTPQGKEYRDDILGVIQRCARGGVPACLMITKYDEHRDDTKNADDVHATLTALVARQNDDQFKILRVSAVGEIDGDWSKRPPAPEDRKPYRLIEGWVWALHRALMSPREQTLQRIPRVNLQAPAAKHTRLAATLVPEIRVVRHSTGSAGRALASIRNGRTNHFLVLDEKKSELCDVSIENTTDTEELGSVITIQDWEQQDNIVAHATAGAMFVASSSPDAIWYATKGQSLARTPLPYPMTTWVPIADRAMVGLDDNDTLHTLVFSAGRWVDRDYYADFINSLHAICGFIRTDSLVVVANGSTCAAIKVNEKGKLGALANVPVSVKFDSAVATINEIGFVAAIKSDNTLVVGREKEHSLGPILPDVPFAVANSANVVAWLGTDRCLHSAVLSPDATRSTLSSPAAKLDEVPDGMCWNEDGTLLLMTFPSGSWAWARHFGF